MLLDNMNDGNLIILNNKCIEINFNINTFCKVLFGYIGCECYDRFYCNLYKKD